MLAAVCGNHIEIADYLWDKMVTATGINKATDWINLGFIMTDTINRASLEWLERKSRGCVRKISSRGVVFFARIMKLDRSAAEFIHDRCPEVGDAAVSFMSAAPLACPPCRNRDVG